MVTIHRPRGCSRCSGSGYRGRFPLGEILVGSDAIERLVVARASASDIRAQARVEGMRGIAEEGAEAVFAGLTGLDELARIVR
jgi:type IV pilus assembly protein PilB